MGTQDVIDDIIPSPTAVFNPHVNLRHVRGKNILFFVFTQYIRKVIGTFSIQQTQTAVSSTHKGVALRDGFQPQTSLLHDTLL